MENEMFNLYLKILGYDNRPDFFEKYLVVPSLLRLKKVGYFCGMDYASKDVYDFPETISRYDHSLTVSLITWKLTGDKKAVLAGLFHDIATPCFSHVIDYMNKDYEKQESTEEKTAEILKKDTYLLKCLEEDNILIDDIIDFKKYSIVDLDRPMLCADRLDGVILTGLFWTKSITIDDVKKIIENLIVMENEYNLEEISFKSMNVAELVLKASELIDIYCHSKEDNYMMELLAKVTKRVIDLKIICYDDLFVLDEEEFFAILENIDDIELEKDLVLFKSISKVSIPDIDMPYIKKRNLNPLVGCRRLKTK